MTNSDAAITAALADCPETVTIGGTGGAAWTTPDATLANGAISRIDIRSGTMIDAINVYYNGEPDGSHGGGGGAAGMFQVQDGYHITKIQSRHGSRVDSLIFIAEPENGKGQSQSSPKYGGNGGSEQIIAAQNGLVLRAIDGRSGHEVDSLTFRFGRPYKIANVVVNTDALAKQLNNANLVNIDGITYQNASSKDTTAKFSSSRNITVANTVTTTTTVRALFGLEISVKASILVVEANAKVNFELETTDTIGSSNSVTESVTRSWDVEVPCPAGMNTTAIIKLYEATVADVPFTYDIVFYEIDDGTIVEKTTIPMTGMVSGTVPATQVEVDTVSTPIPPGSPNLDTTKVVVVS